MNGSEFSPEPAPLNNAGNEPRNKDQGKNEDLPAPLPLLASNPPDGGWRVPEGEALSVVPEMNLLKVESSLGLLRVARVESNPGYVGWNETLRCHFPTATWQGYNGEKRFSWTGGGGV